MNATLVDTLIGNGYRVIPTRGKAPVTNNWQDARYTSYDDIADRIPPSLFNDAQNIGILCLEDTGILGVDIDVYDPFIVQNVVNYLQNKYGNALHLRYGRLPKLLIPFRSTTKRVKAKRSPLYDIPNPTNKPSRIEIIQNHQFVAYGSYVDEQGVKHTYTWKRIGSDGVLTEDEAGLEYISAGNLPEFNDDDIQELFDKLAELCREVGITSKQDTHLRYDADADADDAMMWQKSKISMPMREIRNVLFYIAKHNPAYVDDGETWLRTGMALWHQTDGSDNGYDLWIEWSRLSEKHFNEEDHAKGIHRKRWDSFDPDNGADIVTMRSVIQEYHALQSKAETDKKQEYIERIHAAETDEQLQEVIREIAKSSVIKSQTREAFVAPIKKAYKRIGMEITSTAFIRSQVAFQLDTTVYPDWAKNWVYVDSREIFFNIADKYELSPFSFDNTYNRVARVEGIKETRAHRIAMDVYRLPQVADIVFDPTGGEIIDEGGFRRYANSYRFDTIPEIPEEFDEGEEWAVNVFKEHIFNLVDNRRDAEIFMQWLAWQVQHTGELVGWAVVLQGVEGDGKTSIANIMSGVLGSSNVKVIGSEVVHGSFKSWVSGHVFCVIEELRVTGKDRFEVMNNMKQYITNKEVDLHRKGENVRTVKNFSNYLFLTNDIYGLPISEGDRRYFCISSRFKRRDQLIEFKEQNPEYYSNLIHVANNPHRYAGAIRKFLMEYPIDESFKVHREAPMTETKRRVIQTSLGQDEVAILNSVLSANKQVGMNKMLLCQTVFSKRYIDSERVPSLRRQWKRIFSQFGMYQIAGFVRKNNQAHYFYSNQPQHWTEDGTAEGMISQDMVKPYLDGLYEDDGNIFEDDVPVTDKELADL